MNKQEATTKFLYKLGLLMQEFGIDEFQIRDSRIDIVSCWDQEVVASFDDGLTVEDVMSWGFDK